ncbi:ribonuclease H-like domain-containing protein [Trichophaea hybrida]|nr:ribonuclease H-like domain-containing protein [Trichophaea hybrida]
MCWPDPMEEPIVKTIILDDNVAAKRAAKRWARDKERKAESGVWMWWTDGSRTDDGRVEAAATARKPASRPGPFRTSGRMEVFDAELWAIGIVLRKSVTRAEELRAQGVTTLAIFSDSQAAIRRTAHLDPGPGQQLARAMNKHAWALHGHGIEVVIHWVPGHSGIPGNEEADRQANKAQNDRGYTVRERIFTSAANRARRISEGQSAVKPQWEADKCSKRFSYRLKGKAGSKRSIPMTSVKSLATRFYQLKSGHVLTKHLARKAYEFLDGQRSY